MVHMCSKRCASDVEGSESVVSDAGVERDFGGNVDEGSALRGGECGGDSGDGDGKNGEKDK